MLEGVQTSVLVLGGCGFIGRHAVLSLIAQGAVVTVGTRDPEKQSKKQPKTRFRKVTGASCAK